jgi:heptosyltransferase III
VRIFSDGELRGAIEPLVALHPRGATPTVPLLRRIFRGPRGQRAGHFLDRAGRRLLDRVLDRLLPVPPNVSLDAMTAVRSVLLVRPNFRIGNVLMMAPLVPALRERFPDARLEVLVGDTTVNLLGGLPIDAVHCVSRFHILYPWRFVALFRHLRRTHFDVAVAAGAGSFSGGLYTFLSGARYRIGFAGRGNRFLNVRLPRSRVGHAYDNAPAFARAMGASCPDHPVYHVSSAEDAEAVRILGELGLVDGGTVRPFLGVFVGGHLRKRWPQHLWLTFARELERMGIVFVVFLGPEEVRFAARLRAELSPSVRIISPRPIRIFAALLARARLLVTPDSGAMHLAAALGVPIIGLLQNEKSEFYRPRGIHDQVLMQPSVDMVVAAVTAT